ncbi:helix-turn-helix domain-containing protein [Myxococcota bacterium]
MIKFNEKRTEVESVVIKDGRKYLIAEDISKLIRVSVSKVYHCASKGKILCIRIDGVLGFDADEIEEWLWEAARGNPGGERCHGCKEGKREVVRRKERVHTQRVRKEDMALDLAVVDLFSDLPEEARNERNVMTTSHKGEDVEDIAFFFVQCTNFDVKDFESYLVVHFGRSPEMDRVNELKSSNTSEPHHRMTSVSVSLEIAGATPRDTEGLFAGCRISILPPYPLVSAYARRSTSSATPRQSS